MGSGFSRFAKGLCYPSAKYRSIIGVTADAPPAARPLAYGPPSLSQIAFPSGSAIMANVPHSFFVTGVANLTPFFSSAAAVFSTLSQ